MAKKIEELINDQLVSSFLRCDNITRDLCKDTTKYILNSLEDAGYAVVLKESPRDYDAEYDLLLMRTGKLLKNATGDSNE